MAYARRGSSWLRASLAAHVGAALVCTLILSSAPRPARADVAIDWNNQMIDTIRATGGAPGPISRSMAMMHAAMFDAWNSVERQYHPYQFQLGAPAGASADAAAVGAAHRVLTTLYPSRAAAYDAALDLSLGAIPAGPGRDAGLNLGRNVADLLVAARATDGADDNTPYTFGPAPGDYRPTPPNLPAEPAGPNWGRCAPWTMATVQDFMPPMPPALDSPAYAAALNDVKSLGSRTSAARSPEQTDIAWFWANDRDGSYKPPGQLNVITQTLARQQGLSTGESLRLFALTNLAMADAAMLAWATKYDTAVDLWRPVTGIREAGTGGPGDADGNPDTVADETWEPLADAVSPMGTTPSYTPPFPAYISGHATFGAAHAAVLREYLGTDAVDLTFGSDDMPPDYTRHYTSLEAMARENGRSRIYLGVHWQFDADYAYPVGTQLGAYVFGNYLQPIPEPGAGVMGFGVAALLLRRRRRCASSSRQPPGLAGDRR